MIGTTAGLIAYAAARGVAIGEDEAPILLTKAGDYLATMCWEGYPYSRQDAWPRKGLVYDGTPLLDVNGDDITTVIVDGESVPIEIGDTVDEAATPESVIIATYRLAMEVANGVDLMPTTSGSQVVSESVSGAVSVTYAEGSIGTPLTLPWLGKLIDQWKTCSPTNVVNFPVSRG